MSLSFDVARCTEREADYDARVAEIDLNDVAMFVRAVDRAGFAKVARELGVPTSTVSRAVARLEVALGARLLQRTTRSVHPTSEGRAFYAEVAPAIAALKHAARGVEGADRAARGRLRVTAPNDLGSSFLAEVVVEFAERCPRVDVELELTNRYVDLVEEGFDVAIRAAERLADSALIAHKVGEVEADLYASIAYVQARGMPASPADLSRHACILFRGREGEAEWSLQGPEGEVVVKARGRVSGDDYGFVRGAAVAGGGVALIPRMVAARDVADGKLVRVLPDYVSRGTALHVVHPAARNLPAKVVAFRDFIVEAFARAASRNLAHEAVSVLRRDALPRRRPR
jgi:DNA-binding transcriptional LysR family regulator